MIKYFFIFCLFFISCQSYKLSKSQYVYSQNSLEYYVEPQHFNSKNLSDVDHRLLRSLEDYGVKISEENELEGINMVVFGKNTQANQGYFIFTQSKDSQEFNSCLLYNISKGSVSFSYYFLPVYCASWEVAKPYLVPNNLRIFYGRDN